MNVRVRWWMLFSFMLPCLAFSQQFRGGVQAGVAGTQVAGDKYSGYHKAGLMAGGYVSLGLAPKLEFQLEMEYIQKGSRNLDDPDDPDDVDYRLRVDYIGMPVLLCYKVHEKISVEAGLAMAVLVGHKETQNDLDLTPLLPAFRSTNLSVIGGASYFLGERYRVNIRTDNSVLPARKKEFPGNVKRLFSGWGQYHDILVVSLFYQL